MPIENRLTARRGGSERVDGGAGSGAVADARAAAPRSRQEARLYFNPSGAWGDGLSTDGVVAHSGVGRGGAKATVVEATADALKAGGTHVVKSGETFSSIAAAVYGSAAYYPHLVRANPQANPNNLKLGTVINIPPMEQVKATGSSERGVGAPAVTQDAKLDPTRQYKVQSGDSLYKISVKVYGKSTYVDRIYEANKAAIGPNPTKLKLGMVLELPEKAGTIASTSAGNDAPIGDAQSGPENDGK